MGATFICRQVIEKFLPSEVFSVPQAVQLRRFILAADDFQPERPRASIAATVGRVRPR
jgi:hypothetical protein